MSTNAMLRLSIPKPWNVCSRNCSLKSREPFEKEFAHSKSRNFIPPLPSMASSKTISTDKNKNLNLTCRDASLSKLKSIKEPFPKGHNLKAQVENVNILNRQNKFTTSTSMMNCFKKPKNEQNVIRDRSRSIQSKAGIVSVKDLKTTPPEDYNVEGKEGTIEKETETNFEKNTTLVKEITNRKTLGFRLNDKNSLDFIINDSKVKEDILSIDLSKEENLNLKLIEISWKDEFIFSQAQDVRRPVSIQKPDQVFKVDNQIESNNSQIEFIPSKTINQISESIREENNTNTVTQLSHLNFLQENINKINLGLLTSNSENLRMNREHFPKFDHHEYRKLLTTILMLEYGKSIIEDYFANEVIIDNFLFNHDINQRMRMRMADWMIEVLNNFKSQDQTYFLAMNLMDRYFKFCRRTLKTEELHLIGICCMFIASKFFDIYPIKLKMIADKVSHGKFTSEEIKAKEEEIMKCLNYDILKATVLDFAMFYMEEIFYFFENNFTISDNILSEYLRKFLSTMGVSIKLDCLYTEKIRNSPKYTVTMLNYLRYVVIYLGKMACHDYSLSCERPSLIAASVVLVGLKICEQINNEVYVNEYFIDKLSNVSRHNEYDILQYGQNILYNAQNFDKLFKGMENLKKTHFNSLLEIKETK